MSNYTLGMLIHRMNQYNQFQNRRPEDNSIAFWKEFVKEFFTPTSIYKYSILLSSVGGRHFQPFVLPARILHRYFKSQYQDTMRSCSYILDDPQEFATNVNTYILECQNARVLSVFEDTQICSYGVLRVTFSVNLKIEYFSFDAIKHVEYTSRASIDAKLATFMNTITTTLQNFSNNNANGTSEKGKNKNKNTHNTKNTSVPATSTTATNTTTTATTSTASASTNATATTAEETENNNFLDDILNEKPNNNTSGKNNITSKFDVMENGIESPSANTINLTDDSIFQLSSSGNEGDDATNTFGDISNNTNYFDPSSNSSSTSNISTSTNTPDMTEILNTVKNQLQSTFKSNPPVNEYGVAPQVMRCFEISDIFLSMEDLMDLTLQAGCTPRNAISFWFNSNVTYGK